MHDDELRWFVLHRHTASQLCPSWDVSDEQNLLSGLVIELRQRGTDAPTPCLRGSDDFSTYVGEALLVFSCVDRSKDDGTTSFSILIINDTLGVDVELRRAR